ncbi:putative glutamine amidotransferase [Nocardioides thalensis]|uniref:Putative glutamine amidotransferase n=1 Tax=Nocardioides thalensis TaxID=1914755 RepID=A0A853C8J5_9ACTN|nr:gamma-glutamyl-gamma-aminobutyrate hydrolase family protein [Nocardioides thalensis]NYJ03346.1 putative glutamine amidotransferase [Nocardioides thalensis]
MEERYRLTEVDVFFADYSRAVADAGGLPVELPYDGSSAVVDRLDALLLSGGQDVDPERWGGPAESVRGEVDPARDARELDLLRAALARGIPVLAVCRGMQVLNVALGGTLVPDLAGPLDHLASGRSTGHRHHDVHLDGESLAAELYGAQVTVNSLHHQAVARAGRGLVVTGRSSDGVAEVIEAPGRPVLGVQWHPEWLHPRDPAFDWLVAAATPRSTK